MNTGLWSNNFPQDIKIHTTYLYSGENNLWSCQVLLSELEKVMPFKSSLEIVLDTEVWEFMKT